jgi:RimJ/RimL family protein N-acetyltransferase
MTPVYAFSDEVCSFVAQGLWSGQRTVEGYGAGFATPEEGLVAGIVYHNFDPDTGTIELTAYSSRRDWLNRDRLKWIFSYPFDQLGVRVCVARISEHNTRTLRIWRAFGAELTPIPDLRAEGEAEVIAVLRRDTWKNSKFA